MAWSPTEKFRVTCTFYLGQSGKLLGCQQILHEEATGQLWSHCQSSLWTQPFLLHPQTLTNGSEAVTSLLGHLTHLHTPIPPHGHPSYAWSTLLME